MRKDFLKTVLFSLFLVVSIQFLYRYWKGLRTDPSELILEGKSQDRGSETRVPQPRKKPAFNAHSLSSQSVEAIAQKESSDIPPEPQSNVVEFKVIEGKAVAYGDLVLGEVEPEFSKQKGHAEGPSSIRLWDSPIIPYVTDPKLAIPDRVEKVIEYLRQNTPVKLVPYSGQGDGIAFVPTHEHCLSYLGRTGGLQPIFLSSHCEFKQIVHEIMHALGFVHEQSRSDRDQYVEVNWNNIEDQFKNEFVKVPESWNEPLRGRPFNFQSVMLYNPYAFATDPSQPTLKTRQNEPISPKMDGLSPEDLQRIRQLFRM